MPCHVPSTYADHRLGCVLFPCDLSRFLWIQPQACFDTRRSRLHLLDVLRLHHGTPDRPIWTQTSHAVRLNWVRHMLHSCRCWTGPGHQTLARDGSVVHLRIPRLLRSIVSLHPIPVSLGDQLFPNAKRWQQSRYGDKLALRVCGRNNDT